MQVFISWSGERSRLAALAIRRLLRRVIQRLNPWMSAVDLAKGTIWPTELMKVLDETNIGILCVTNENLASPWMLFEAGALVKKIDRSSVIPFLLDFGHGSLHPPLSMLNASEFSKEEVLKLLSAINDKLPGADRLQQVELEESFGKWWPEFEAECKAIEATTKEAPKPPSDSDRIAAIEGLLRDVIPVIQDRVSTIRPPMLMAGQDVFEYEIRFDPTVPMSILSEIARRFLRKVPGCFSAKESSGVVFIQSTGQISTTRFMELVEPSGVAYTGLVVSQAPFAG